MKIRNGFVSNSSSSSFLIGYEPTMKIVGAQAILDYVRDHLEDSITVDFGDMNEGNDIFELTYEMKRLILRFPEEFLKGISRLTSYEEVDGEWKHVHVEPIAYINCIQVNNEYGFYYDTQEESENLSEKRRATILKELPDALIDEVLIDNNSCGSSWMDNDLNEFASRYFTEDYENYCYQSHSQGWSAVRPHPYAVAYSFCTRDKKEALEYLTNPERNLKCLIARDNVIYDTIYCEENSFKCTDLDFWCVGKKETEALTKNLEDFMGEKNIIFYYNADVIDSESSVTVGQRKLDMYFGRASETPSGKDFNSFKKAFLK